MKQLVCFLFFVVTLLEVASSAHQKEQNQSENRITEEQLKSMIGQSLKFEENEISQINDLDFDIGAEVAPQDNPSLVINLPTSRIETREKNSKLIIIKESKTGSTSEENESGKAKSSKSTEKVDDGEVAVVIKDPENQIEKLFRRSKSGRVEQYIINHGKAEKFVRDENGWVEKITEDPSNGIKKKAVKKGEKLELKTQNSITWQYEKLIKKEGGEIIKVVHNSRKYQIEVAIFEKGRWIHALTHEFGKQIVLGPNSYGALIYLDIDDIPMDTKHFLEQIDSQGGLCQYNERSEKRGNDISKTFLNRGIITNWNCIMINDYQKCSRTHSINLSNLEEDEKIEIISEESGTVEDPKNLGYLVHFSPDGRKWRTQDQEIIDRILGGDETLIKDCGYTEYRSSDGKVTWIKNEGIIEDGKFVVKSKRLLDLGAVYKYVDGESTVMWTKTQRRGNTTSNENDPTSTSQGGSKVESKPIETPGTNSGTNENNKQSTQSVPSSNPKVVDKPVRRRRTSNRRTKSGKRKSTTSRGSPNKLESSPPGN